MPFKTDEEKRAYAREYSRRRWATDPAYKAVLQARIRRNNKRVQALVQQALRDFRAAGCCLCGEREPICLTAHHRDPAHKVFNIGDAASHKVGPKRLTAELAKCVCLCHNCHAKLHGGLVTL